MTWGKPGEHDLDNVLFHGPAYLMEAGHIHLLSSRSGVQGRAELSWQPGGHYKSQASLGFLIPFLSWVCPIPSAGNKSILLIELSRQLNPYSFLECRKRVFLASLHKLEPRNRERRDRTMPGSCCDLTCILST